MQIRPLILVTSFILLGSNFSPGLCQETLESKADRLLTKVYASPNFPKFISPVKIHIDKTRNKRQSFAYYVRQPKRFFGPRTLKTPEIHLLADYVRHGSDDTILVTITHELGHHFDTTPELYLEPKTPIERLVKEYDRTDKLQYFAEAFALYILGEDQYTKGRREQYLTYLKDKGVYWLYLETNPILHQYYLNQGELWINYWRSGAQSRLNDVIKKIQTQNDLYLKTRF